MMTKKELDVLCESGHILDKELTDEEVLKVNVSLMHPQDTLKFIKKYSKVLANRAADVEVIKARWRNV